MSVFSKLIRRSDKVPAGIKYLPVEQQRQALARTHARAATGGQRNAAAENADLSDEKSRRRFIADRGRRRRRAEAAAGFRGQC